MIVLGVLILLCLAIYALVSTLQAWRAPRREVLREGSHRQRLTESSRPKPERPTRAELREWQDLERLLRAPLTNEPERETT